MNFYTKWIAYSTMVVKETKRTLRIWPQSLLPSVITSILYFLIFGHVIGQRVGNIEGFDYNQYIAPGLIMLFIINNSYSAAVSAFFFAKFQKSIDELLVSPMSELLLLLGYTSGGIVRGILVGILVTITALFFTHLTIHNILIIVIVGLLASAIFSIIGIINGIYAKKFDDIALIPTFILTPMTYLGGVFYSLAMLPSFWHWVSLFNPIVYIVEAFRYGFLGIGKNYLGMALIFITITTLLLFLFAWSLLRKGIGIRN